MTDRLTGTITRLRADKGFGFLDTPDGAEYFFHRSAAPDFQTLQPGDRVSFEPHLDTPRGPRAEQVRVDHRGVESPF